MGTNLKYIGSHRPYGMVVDVDDNLVESALEDDEFILVNQPIDVKPKGKKIVKVVKKQISKDW